MTETTLTNTAGNPAFPRATDYPIPSPDWYYADIYHLFQQARITIDSRLEEMQSKSDRDPDFDHKLGSTLDRFQREMAALRTIRYPGATFNPPQ